MPWTSEFPDDQYSVPRALTNRSDLVDVSWRSDTAPSFTTLREVEREQSDPDFNGYRLRLWVEHNDRECREACSGQFAVYLYREPDACDGECITLYDGDEVLPAIAALLGGAELLREYDDERLRRKLGVTNERELEQDRARPNEPCEYCGALFYTAGQVADHRPHCYANPDAAERDTCDRCGEFTDTCDDRKVKGSRSDCACEE